MGIIGALSSCVESPDSDNTEELETGSTTAALEMTTTESTTASAMTSTSSMGDKGATSTSAGTTTSTVSTSSGTSEGEDDGMDTGSGGASSDGSSAGATSEGTTDADVSTSSDPEEGSDSGSGEPPSSPDIPMIAGDWWRITPPPELEAYASGMEEAVDFTIFQARNGTWQLVSCIRNTAFPGNGRLFYRWTSDDLMAEGWTPEGIFRTADVDFGHQEGRLQAPHVVIVDDLYYMFYNSDGAFAMVSEDGETFEDYFAPNGSPVFFQMARDVMMFDHRDVDGLWHAFWTQYDERFPPTNHTISRRTAPALEGPWSDPREDLGFVSEFDPDDDDAFWFAESPFVFRHRGWYYRLEQMNVIAASTLDGLWETDVLETLTPQEPRTYLAPEIVHHQGEDYIAGYSYQNGRDGIYMAHIVWESQ